MKPQVVILTVPNVEVARKVSHAVLSDKLAACVQIVPGVESHYWWKGKLEQSAEVLLILKADVGHFQALTEAIKKIHTFECPEILAMIPSAIDADYAHWWRETLETLE